MKKKFLVLWGGVCLLCITILIYSCTKQSPGANAQTLSTQGTTDPVKLVAAATAWYANRTQAPRSSTISNSKPTYVLPPTWKEAEMHQASDGQTVLIAPGPDFKLSPNSTQGFLRKFVFTEVYGGITAGRIVEIFGAANYISANKATLFENYIDGKMTGFTGTVVSYDARYHYIGSEVFNNGKKVGARAWLQKGRLKNANSNNTPITEDTGNCIDWYLVTDYSDGTSSEEYLYTSCYPTSNNSEVGGGGSNNDDPPPTPDCTDDGQFDAIPTAILLGSGASYTGTLSPGITNKRDYPWQFCQSPAGNWSYWSTEQATLFLDGQNNWEFKSILHGRIAMSGVVIGGTLTVTEGVPPIIVLGKYNAAVTLSYSVSGEAVCKGMPGVQAAGVPAESTIYLQAY